jgi:chromosome segregation ATPase
MNVICFLLGTTQESVTKTHIISSSMPPKAPPIEGVEVLDPEGLKKTDFERFRNDELYFIAYVMFYRDTAGSAKPEQRVMALTPFALFITDLDGTMDRATRYEDISEILQQRRVTKKLFGSETHMHFVLKVPREIDWHISFDISKADAISKKFADVMGLVWAHKMREMSQYEDEEDDAANDGKKNKKKKIKLRFTDVDASDDISNKVSKDAAEDYVPPEEIKRRNREQQQMLDRMEEVSGEIVTLQKQIEDARSSCSARQEELKQLEGKYGVELSELRSQKQSLQHRQVTMHKQITNGEIELVKLQADVARYREQLDEERANYASLVEKRLSSAGDEVSQKQHDMMSLRQKAQQKELNKAQEKGSALKQSLSVKPRYEGAPALVQKAEGLERKIDEAVEAWTKDMESSNKIEKFLDAINAEISRVSNQISEKNDEKQSLIEKREAAATTANQQQQRRDNNNVSFDALDDDLPAVPNQSVIAMPSSARSQPDRDADLLSSSTEELPKAMIHGTGGRSDLDDFLEVVSPPIAAVRTTQPPVVLDDDLF